MSRDVVVMFVHGINTTNQNYYEPLRDLIVAELGPKTAKNAIFRSVFWADIVRGRQQEYWHYAMQLGRLRPHTIHRLVLEGLGDAAAYQKTEQMRNSAYADIQARVRKTLRDAALPQEDSRPLVVIAHSLGCHIVSTYAWDLHKFKNPTAYWRPGQADKETQGYIDRVASMPSLERLDTFAGFITLGCNMPLFTFTFGPQHVIPITQRPAAPLGHMHVPAAFPGAALDQACLERARWLNFYSLNDPFGYPLGPLNDAYDDEERLEDIKTTSEFHGPRTARQRLFLWLCRTAGFQEAYSSHAHLGYWHDPAVARQSAELIRSLITTEPAPPAMPPLFGS